MRVAFWIAAVPALLLSTASVQAAGAFSAGLSLGGSVIKLPTGQNGILTSGNVTIGGDSEPLIYAPTVGFSAAVGLGKWGEYDAFAGLNLFAGFGSASSSLTQNFSGIGTVYIPGLSLPDSGSITLSTTRGIGIADADAAVVSVSPQSYDNSITSSSTTVAVGATTGAQLSYDVGGPPNAFAVAGANTTVTSLATDGSALAYGGIADTSGSLLIITGDLAGLTISTQTNTTVLYAGGDMTVGVTKLQDETTAVQAYAGPSYRYLGQWTNTNTGASAIVVNIPEAADPPAIHPIWEQNTVVTAALNSHYFGGVVGAGISRQVSEQVSVALGAEASLYYATAYLSGQGSVTTRDGVSEQNAASPTITVLQDPVNVTTGQIAVAARAQGSATYAVAENVGLTLAGSVEYLSAVARPYAGAEIVTSGAGNASWSSASGGNTSISFGDMFVFTGTVSLTGQF